MFLLCFMYFFIPDIYALENELSKPSSTQINSATKLARCRVHCIDAFSYRFSPLDSDPSMITKEKCLTDTDCWMCWDYCEMFQNNFAQWGNMCHQKTLCFDGCRLACSVYSSISDPSSPYRRDIWSFPTSNPTLEINVTAGWLRLQWPRVVPLTTILPPLPHTLYVIFWHPSTNRPWLQLEQTLSTSYETRHGDIVISATESEFVLLAVTRDGLVATTTISAIQKDVVDDEFTSTASTDEIQLIEEKSDQTAKFRFVLAIIGASLLAGILVSLGLFFLYHMINHQRRHHPLGRTNAVRFRVLSKRNRQRYESASSRVALVTNLNVAKLDNNQEGKKLQKPIPLHNLYTSTPIKRNSHDRFHELFKGTIFESPPNMDVRKESEPRLNNLTEKRFQIDAIFTFRV